MDFETLKHEFPRFAGDYTPPWGLPTREDFARIEAKHGLRYPEAFIAFQTDHAARLPSFPEGFRWANPGLEPYLSLEDLIESTQELVLPAFLPFADDNGDIIGLLPNQGRTPVVLYDHADQTLYEEAEGFVEWLRQQYLRRAGGQA